MGNKTPLAAVALAFAAALLTATAITQSTAPEFLQRKAAARCNEQQAAKPQH